ncbi:hypothetical protein ADUPG1_009777, partial [Aduncisulcus paluster]
SPITEQGPSHLLLYLASFLSCISKCVEKEPRIVSKRKSLQICKYWRDLCSLRSCRWIDAWKVLPLMRSAILCVLTEAEWIDMMKWVYQWYCHISSYVPEPHEEVIELSSELLLIREQYQAILAWLDIICCDPTRFVATSDLKTPLLTVAKLYLPLFSIMDSKHFFMRSNLLDRVTRIVLSMLRYLCQQDIDASSMSNMLDIHTILLSIGKKGDYDFALRRREVVEILKPYASTFLANIVQKSEYHQSMVMKFKQAHIEGLECEYTMEEIDAYFESIKHEYTSLLSIIEASGKKFNRVEPSMSLFDNVDNFYKIFFYFYKYDLNSSISGSNPKIQPYDDEELRKGDISLSKAIDLMKSQFEYTKLFFNFLSYDAKFSYCAQDVKFYTDFVNLHHFSTISVILILDCLHSRYKFQFKSRCYPQYLKPLAKCAVSIVVSWEELAENQFKSDPLRDELYKKDWFSFVQFKSQFDSEHSCMPLPPLLSCVKIHEIFLYHRFECIYAVYNNFFQIFRVHFMIRNSFECATRYNFSVWASIICLLQNKQFYEDFLHLVCLSSDIGSYLPIMIQLVIFYLFIHSQIDPSVSEHEVSNSVKGIISYKYVKIFDVKYKSYKTEVADSIKCIIRDFSDKLEQISILKKKSKFNLDALRIRAYQQTRSKRFVNPFIESDFLTSLQKIEHAKLPCFQTAFCTKKSSSIPYFSKFYILCRNIKHIDLVFPNICDYAFENEAITKFSFLPHIQSLSIWKKLDNGSDIRIFSITSQGKPNLSSMFEQQGYEFQWLQPLQYSLFPRNMYQPREKHTDGSDLSRLLPLGQSDFFSHSPLCLVKIKESGQFGIVSEIGNTTRYITYDSWGYLRITPIHRKSTYFLNHVPVKVDCFNGDEWTGTNRDVSVILVPEMLSTLNEFIRRIKRIVFYSAPEIGDGYCFLQCHRLIPSVNFIDIRPFDMNLRCIIHEISKKCSDISIRKSSSFNYISPISVSELSPDPHSPHLRLCSYPVVSPDTHADSSMFQQYSLSMNSCFFSDFDARIERRSVYEFIEITGGLIELLFAE